MDDTVGIRIKAIVARQLDVENDKVTADASFSEDLEADSLELMEMVMAFEEEFGIEVGNADVDRLKTVGDAINYVRVTICASTPR